MFLVKSLLTFGSVMPLCSGMAVSFPSNESNSDHGYPPTLSLTNPVLTSKWIEGSKYTQIVELIVKNTHATNFLTVADTLKVTISSSSLDTVVPGTLTRLAPGQSSVLQIGVKNKASIDAGTLCNATVDAVWGTKYGAAQTNSTSLSGQCGIGDYTNTTASVNHHSNPDWYNEIKFGIFIHWGVYSAPAFGNVGSKEEYAEWYWMQMTRPNDRAETYQYHLDTYGENFTYDQFISNFTASKFDAKSWMDIVAGSGAQYVVPVTKHHDGFALFNFSTGISTRSSVHYGPKRDFIKELLDAAKTYYPSIRRGTYFSLPEWFNPAYKKYASTAGTNFPGGPPVNPYTGAEETYTGYVPAADFIQNIQVPQQNVLAYDYETEIMWCDIAGSANDVLNVVAPWFNWARDKGRQVSFNNRCGLSGDFSTPEYSTNKGIVTKKWESNRGMDPYSFGYNYQTPDSAYLTGNDIVQSLVDIVSKNGNFLLDIGPKNDGTIPAIMQAGLADAGTWIKAHGESIFKTRYWINGPGTGNFRYTTTKNAFYIHYKATPENTILVPDAVPYLPRDTVTVVGGSMSGSVVGFTDNGNGTSTLTLSNEQIAADKYVWTFKIAYTSTW